MKQRVHILKHMYLDKCPITNYKSEIYSSRRHNTKFHRFAKFSTGTDESDVRKYKSSKKDLNIFYKSYFDNTLFAH